MTRPKEETHRTLVVAISLWALATIFASVDGVFAKLSTLELVALAAFGFGFGVATVYLDRRVRALLATIRTRSLLTFAVEVDLALAVAGMLAAGFAEGQLVAALARFPLAGVLLFVLPVAGVLHVLLAERLLRPRPRLEAKLAR